MKVPLVDLELQNGELAEELGAAFERVVASGRLVLGPHGIELEETIARRVGVRFAVGVSSGSDALLCALMAVGVGPGDEVLTTPFSFFATAESIVRAGATPVFADVDERTFNLDVHRAAGAIGPRCKAIVPVHLFGQPVDLMSFSELARAHGLALVEDAAQALGSEFDGLPAASVGVASCLSFFPSKPLGGLGDGGMVLTSDPDVARACRALRVHGAASRGEHERIGGNFRLDEIQAAALTVKARHLDHWLAQRRELARAYDEAFRPLSGELQIPYQNERARSAYCHYTVTVRRRRDELVAFLAEAGIAAGVYYPKPLHLQRALGSLGGRVGDFPVSEKLASRVLSLPLFPGMSVKQFDWVVSSVRKFYA